MTIENTEHQESTNPPLLIASVGGSTSTKELLECTVCWGGGKIEIDDYGNEEDCTWCNGDAEVRTVSKKRFSDEKEVILSITIENAGDEPD